MSLRFNWNGDPDVIAQTRLRYYAKAQKELKDYQEGIREDGRAKSGDRLLALRDGEAVGTTTSLSMTMWMRGAALPCQGVAWVGTIRSARRSDGIASQLMQETLKKAREREQIVSALMPFRVSYYEHFGFGVAEKRAEWSVPLSILPHGSTQGIRHFEEADDDKVRACRQRQVETGQCDIETSPAAWKNRRDHAKDGFELVDANTGGWMFIADQIVDAKRCVRVVENGWDSIDGLKRQLHALANLRDQYHSVIIQLPTDLPLDQLLRERQIPHRIVEHVSSGVKIQTRMMIRVLDHARFFEKLNLPKSARGAATVAVRETEGTVNKFRLEVEAGRATAKPTDASADIECRDVEWSSIVCGALPAATAMKLGVIKVNKPESVDFLDCLTVGPAPFCGEYF